MARNYKHSLTKDDYKRKTEAINRWEVFWGTPRRRESRLFTSWRMARHPMLAWLDEVMREAAQSKNEETMRAAMKLRARLPEMAENEVRDRISFEIDMPHIDITMSLVMVRLPKPV